MLDPRFEFLPTIERLILSLAQCRRTYPTRVWWTCAALITVILLTPLFLVPIPPLLDYPNHLARMYVLAHPENNIVRSFYSPAWGIVPYAVTDGLAVLLQHAFSLLTTGKIMLATALILPLAGMTAFHYALYHRLSLWILAFGVFAYNTLFLLCLYNFGISCGVAFLFAATWVTLRSRHQAWNILLSIALAAFLFLIHLYGAVLYLLIIGSHELALLPCLDCRSAVFWKQIPRTMLRLLPAALVILAMEVLSSSYASSSQTVYFGADYKLAELAFPWTGYVSGGIAIGLMAWMLLCAGLKTQALALAPGAGICAAICFLLYLVTPFELAGAALFSSRFIVMSAMILWAGIVPRQLSGPTKTRLTIAMIGLLAFNLGSTSAAWLNEEKDIDALRQVIASVKPGSRVLYVTGTDDEMDDYAPRAPFGENLTDFAAYTHFPALLVFERNAFWPFMLSVKGTMPIKVTAPFNRLAMSQGSPVGYDCLTSDCDEDTLVSSPYLRHWQQDFDYVLLLPLRAIPEARTILPDQLNLIAINDFAALYQIKHDLPDHSG